MKRKPSTMHYCLSLDRIWHIVFWAKWIKCIVGEETWHSMLPIRCIWLQWERFDPSHTLKGTSHVLFELKKTISHQMTETKKWDSSWLVRGWNSFHIKANKLMVVYVSTQISEGWGCGWGRVHAKVYTSYFFLKKGKRLTQIASVTKAQQ